MARDTRNECSRHCIFLESYISLPSQWFACRMSLNESSVQGKYLRISRLGTADPADLGRVSQLCPFQIQALCAHAALMTLDRTWTSSFQVSSSSECQHYAHLDKKHSHTRVYSSLGTQTSGKVRNSDGEEVKKGTRCWWAHPTQQCHQRQVLALRHIHTRTQECKPIA